MTYPQRVARPLFVLAAIVGTVAPAQASWVVTDWFYDRELTQPATESPIVSYSSLTGNVTVDTDGPNNELDSSPDAIGADDVGLISLLVETAVPGLPSDAGFSGLLPLFDPVTQIAWAYTPYFNGKVQLQGNVVGVGQFLTPGVTDVFAMPPGLTDLSSFDSVGGNGTNPVNSGDPLNPDGRALVEMGTNLAAGQSGRILFGAMVFVPEPSMIPGAALFVLGLLIRLRGRG